MFAKQLLEERMHVLMDFWLKTFLALDSPVYVFPI